MDKKIKRKTTKPKTIKPKTTKPKTTKKTKSSKPKSTKKPKSSKPKQKGGSDNIANTTEGLFKSFYYFGKDLFAEIDSLTKLPGQLSAIPNTKVSKSPPTPLPVQEEHF